MNQEFQDLPNVLSAKEVQTYLGISRTTVYRLFHDEKFPAFHIGNRLLVQAHRRQQREYMRKKRGASVDN